MKKDYIDAMNEYTEADKPEVDKSEAEKPGDPNRPDPKSWKKAQK